MIDDNLYRKFKKKQRYRRKAVMDYRSICGIYDPMYCPGNVQLMLNDDKRTSLDTHAHRYTCGRGRNPEEE